MRAFIEVTRPAPEIGLVTINRPEKRNALNEAAWGALAEAFETLGTTPELRAIVITGVPGAFCAGDDIGAFSRVKDDPVARQRYWDTIMSCYAAVSEVSVPVIAAVDGPCMGGGMTLALRTDFRIVGPRASFAVPPAKLGIVYPADSTARLARAVGGQAARFMIYTGEKVEAAGAVALGLAWGDVAEDPRAAALALAEKIGDKAPLTLAAAKRVFEVLGTELPERIAEEVERRTREAEASADYEEGVRAFAEKRAPVFRGR